VLADPMLDMSLFRNRRFSTAVLAMMLTMLSLSGCWLMVFQYLQGVLNLTPIQAGLVTLPSNLLQVVSALLVPRLLRYTSAARLIPAGLALAVPGFLAMVLVGGEYSAQLVILSTAIMGVGVMP